MSLREPVEATLRVLAAGLGGPQPGSGTGTGRPPAAASVGRLRVTVALIGVAGVMLGVIVGAALKELQRRHVERVDVRASARALEPELIRYATDLACAAEASLTEFSEPTDPQHFPRAGAGLLGEASRRPLEGAARGAVVPARGCLGRRSDARPRLRARSASCHRPPRAVTSPTRSAEPVRAPRPLVGGLVPRNQQGRQPRHGAHPDAPGRCAIGRARRAP